MILGHAAGLAAAQAINRHRKEAALKGTPPPRVDFHTLPLPPLYRALRKGGSRLWSANINLTRDLDY